MVNLVCCTYLVNAIFDDKALIFCNLEIDEKKVFMVGTCPVAKGLNKIIFRYPSNLSSEM